jgi:hypothetical protein
VRRIERILGARYGLSPFEATRLRRDAEVLESEAPDTVRFTRAIKDAVPYEDRMGVIEALWDVVLADGVRDDEEDALLRLVAPLARRERPRFEPRAAAGRSPPRMIASLPMYDRPETAGANDRLWAGVARALAARGIAAPAALDRTTGMWEAWLSPDLLLSQTCGLPYRTRLHGQVALVATPVYDLPGTPPGHYHSVLVARRDDARRRFADFDGATLAYNDADSQSGWAAPMGRGGRSRDRLRRTLATGAHRASARAVAEGTADIAAIDALTWRMIRRWDERRRR